MFSASFLLQLSGYKVQILLAQIKLCKVLIIFVVILKMVKLLFFIIFVMKGLEGTTSVSLCTM